MGLSIDREKVIKGLERCPRLPFDLCFSECTNSDCPYNNDFGIEKLHQDAITMLKGQDAVEPVESGIPGVLLCGACKCSVMREEGYRFRHCPWCGKKVKWDG